MAPALLQRATFAGAIIAMHAPDDAKIALPFFRASASGPIPGPLGERQDRRFPTGAPLPERRGPQGYRHRHPCWTVRLPAWALRLRQVDATLRARRPFPAERWAHRHRWKDG